MFSHNPSKVKTTCLHMHTEPSIILYRYFNPCYVYIHVRICRSQKGGSVGSDEGYGERSVGPGPEAHWRAH